MPIFRKLVKEVSKAIFAIEAKTQKEADEKFEKFLSGEDDENKYYEYRDFMNSQCNEEVTDLMTFQNEDDYNRYAPSGADFWLKVEEKKDEEPKYDLYFIFDKGLRKVWHDINLAEMITHITAYNSKYILNPSGALDISYQCYINARDHGTNPVAYRLTERKGT